MINMYMYIIYITHYGDDIVAGAGRVQPGVGVWRLRGMTHGPHWPLKHVTSEHRSFIADLNVHPLATPWSTAAVTIKICTRSSRLELFRSHGQSALVVVPIEDNSIVAYKYIYIVYLYEFAFLPLLHTKVGFCRTPPTAILLLYHCDVI